MDPNENLEEQRELLKKRDAHGNWYRETDAAEFADLVQALDEWLSNGGFLPQAWAR